MSKQFDDLRNKIKDKEDISYATIDKLIDILEQQNDSIHFLTSKLIDLEDRISQLGKNCLPNQ